MSEINPSEPGAKPAKASESSSLFYVVIFGLFMLAGLLYLAWLGSTPASQAVGQPLPRIDLQPLIIAERSLEREDLLGKYSVIHFWGTWCPPCVQEFPDFVDLATEFQDSERVLVLSVSCSPGPEYDLEQLRLKTEEFLSRFSQPIPTYSDATALTRQQLALLLPNGSLGYPTTIVADPEGTIIEAIEGYYPGEMEKLTDLLLTRTAQ